MTNRKLFDDVLLSFHVRSELQDLLTDGVLQTTLPEVHAMVGFGGVDQGHKDLWEHTKQVVFQCPRDLTIRWAALFHDTGKVHCFRRTVEGVSFHGHEIVSARLFRQAAARTLFWTPKELKAISSLIEELGYVEAYTDTWTDSAVRRMRKHVGGTFNDLLTLSKADITTRHEYKRRAHHQRIQELQERSDAIVKADSITPALPKGLGTELIKAFGIEPDRTLGDLMKALKQVVDSGGLERPPSIEQVLQYVRDTYVYPSSSDHLQSPQDRYLWRILRPGNAGSSDGGDSSPTQ